MTREQIQPDAQPAMPPGVQPGAIDHATATGDTQAANEQGVALVLERNYFYRDRYRWQLRITTAMLVLCFLLALVLGWVLLHPAKPVYFATDADGRIRPLVPLDRPHENDAHIVQWAADIARRTYSFDFVHWREQLAALEVNFTPAGYQQFLAALKKSGNVAAVRSRRLVGSAVTSPPVITAEGVLNGVYTWEMEVPLRVSYLSSEQTIEQSLLVNMTIQRGSTLQTRDGLVVDRFLTLVQ